MAPTPEELTLLNIEIAEQIFGHTVYRTVEDYPRTGPNRLWPVGINSDRMPQYLDDTIDPSGTRDVPPYSTDIGAAMQVVAYFTTAPAAHPCLHHFEMVFYAGESQWKVEIGGRECGRPGRPFALDQDDWSESLPEAICRAAISALQGDGTS